MSWISQLLHKDWFLGFLSGIAATLLGFVSTILWDIWKMKTESARRAKAIVEIISEEIADNRINLASNLEALGQDLDALSEGRSVVKALQPLKTGFWEIAKTNTPSELFTRERLAELRNLGAFAEAINEQIRSRETYRLHNSAMDSFKRRMKVYDETLVTIFNQFDADMSAYQSGKNH